MFIMGVIIGALFGGTLVLLLFCMVIAGGRADREMESWSLKEGFTMAEADKTVLKQASAEKGMSEKQSGKMMPETGKDQISFVDTNNQELFWIEDGESIELFSENGDRQTCLCHYLDRRHVSIDGKRWEMLTFARWMKKRGITYIPSTKQRREGGVVA